MHDLKVKRYAHGDVGDDMCLCGFCLKAFVGLAPDDLCPDCISACEILPWFKAND